MRCPCCCPYRIRAAPIPTGSTGSPVAAARRSNRSRILWSTGWHGARSLTAPARSSPARRARRSTATAAKRKSTRPWSTGSVTGELGARVRGGLGIVPGRTARDGFLWHRPISSGEYHSRLDSAHRPYHAAIADALTAIVGEHGGAVLLDCHSMPPRPDGCPQIVIGDRHGHSAAPRVTATAERIAREHGYSVHRNIPYAGGWIVERHGAPRTNVHALQIEIDRRCYLGPDLRVPGPGFDRASQFLAALAAQLGELLLAPDAAEAAE